MEAHTEVCLLCRFAWGTVETAFDIEDPLGRSEHDSRVEADGADLHSYRGLDPRGRVLPIECSQDRVELCMALTKRDRLIEELLRHDGEKLGFICRSIGVQ